MSRSRFSTCPRVEYRAVGGVTRLLSNWGGGCRGAVGQGTAPIVLQSGGPNLVEASRPLQAFRVYILPITNRIFYVYMKRIYSLQLKDAFP